METIVNCKRWRYRRVGAIVFCERWRYRKVETIVKREHWHYRKARWFKPRDETIEKRECGRHDSAISSSHPRRVGRASRAEAQASCEKNYIYIYMYTYIYIYIYIERERALYTDGRCCSQTAVSILRNPHASSSSAL